jgi:uncharacterized membrane protein
MRFLFWVFSCALLAVSTHLAYVLFVPSNTFKAGIDSALKTQGENTFSILDPSLQTRLLPFAGPVDLVGFCRFNLSSGPVRFFVEVPKGYWTFAVYTLRGQQVYALNDRQADTERFNVTLRRTASLLEQVSDAGGGDDTPISDSGWEVRLSEPEGVAFLWMPHADPLRRLEAERALRKSLCSMKKDD